MNEPIPHISFDINLGKQVELIDIDYEALVTYMRERGFDDETIAYTSIYFSAEDATETRDDGKRYVSYGRYEQTPGYIKIYPHEAAYIFRQLSAELTDPEEIEQLRSQLNAEWSMILTNVLNHELEHKRMVPGLKINPDKINDLIEPYRPLGRTALRHQEYENSTLEVHCREVANQGPTNLVQIQLKPPVY